MKPSVMSAKLYVWVLFCACVGLLGCPQRNKLQLQKNTEVIRSQQERLRSIRTVEKVIGADWDRKPHQGVTFQRRLLLMLHLGEQYRLMENNAEAYLWFQRVRHLDPRGPLVKAAGAGMTILHYLLQSGCQYSSSQRGCRRYQASLSAWRRLIAALERVGAEELLNTQNADRLMLLAEDAVRLGKSSEAVSLGHKALQAAKSDLLVQRRLCWRLQHLQVPLSTQDQGLCQTTRS